MNRLNPLNFAVATTVTFLLLYVACAVAVVLHAEKVGKEVWYRTDPGAVRAGLESVLDYLSELEGRA